MVKAKTLYIVDSLALVSFLICAVGGYVIYFYMPATMFGALGMSVLGIPRHTWAFVHQWAGHAFVLAVVTHFLLHWSWFVRMTKTFFRAGKKQKHEN